MENVLELCEKGNLVVIKKCLQEGVSPNYTNNEGETPLQVAAANGNLDLMILLLNSGALVDLPNNYGWTPLMHAAKYGHEDVVAHLIKSKAKVNITNKLGISAVLAAACSGSLPTVKLLMEAGAMVQHMSAGNETNESDLSTVMAVSFFGHYPILQYLIQNGGIINHSSPVTGLTPLMLAVCAGNEKIVQFLLESGADYNAMDICGRTASDYSHIFNHSEIKGMLENLRTAEPNDFSSKSNVFQIIKEGDILRIKSVLERDPHLVNSSQSPSGITPLMTASMLGLFNVVSILLAHRASLNIQDTENGWTALMHATFNGHSDVVQLLIDAGADIQIHAKNGSTAFDLAQHNDCTSVLNVLSTKLAPQELKNTLLVPESISRSRSSVSEKLHSKRNLSQTRVKEWIGGMAQHLQNKVLTLRSPKYSENTFNTDITAGDESPNEVFVEHIFQTDELSKELSNCPSMLPPEEYLADALKEHKVEAIVPPFPPILNDYITSTKEIYKMSGKKSQKNTKNSLRVPNLLKSHARKKQSVNWTIESKEKNLIPIEGSVSKEIKRPSSPCSQNETPTLTSDAIFEQTEENKSKLNPGYPGDLTRLLNQASLQKYAETFRNQEIDMETFLHLTPADLCEIGIKGTEAQEKLLNVIKKLQTSN